MKIITFITLLISIVFLNFKIAECKDAPAKTERLTTEENKKMCAEGPKSQIEINLCMGLRFEKLNDELNRTYQQIKVIHQKNKPFLEKLKKAQLAWIAFRDAELEAIYPLPDKGMEYGSSYGMCYYTWKSILTKERIRQLKKWIDGYTEDVPKEDNCGVSLLPRQVDSFVEKYK